eukprot:PhF_6_TR6781/c0_g1_i1/m.9760
MFETNHSFKSVACFVDGGSDLLYLPNLLDAARTYFVSSNVTSADASWSWTLYCPPELSQIPNFSPWSVSILRSSNTKEDIAAAIHDHALSGNLTVLVSSDTQFVEIVNSVVQAGRQIVWIHNDDFHIDSSFAHVPNVTLSFSKLMHAQQQQQQQQQQQPNMQGLHNKRESGNVNHFKHDIGIGGITAHSDGSSLLLMARGRSFQRGDVVSFVRVPNPKKMTEFMAFDVTVLQHAPAPSTPPEMIPTEGAERERGKVNNFNPQKGIGGVFPEGGEVSLYFHTNDVRLHVGDIISFYRTPNPRKAGEEMAVNIQLIERSVPQGMSPQMGGLRERGKIITFNESRGCGGIRPDGDEGISLLFLSSTARFERGDNVTFVRIPNPKKPTEIMAGDVQHEGFVVRSRPNSTKERGIVNNFQPQKGIGGITAAKDNISLFFRSKSREFRVGEVVLFDRVLNPKTSAFLADNVVSEVY